MYIVCCCSCCHDNRLFCAAVNQIGTKRKRTFAALVLFFFSETVCVSIQWKFITTSTSLWRSLCGWSEKKPLGKRKHTMRLGHQRNQPRAPLPQQLHGFIFFAASSNNWYFFGVRYWSSSSLLALWNLVRSNGKYIRRHLYNDTMTSDTKLYRT